MINLKSISLDDKPVFDKYFRLFPYENSEYSFANTFSWQDGYKLRYFIHDETLCMLVQYGDSPAVATFPIGRNPQQCFDLLMEYFKESNAQPLIRLYGQDDIDKFEELMKSYGKKYTITENVFLNDYVYNTQDLINLSGKKYHAKRNHINKFKQLYNYTYEVMTAKTALECLELYNRWQSRKDDDYVDTLTDSDNAVYKMLTNFDALLLKGGILRVDGVAVAFSVGEYLNPKMAIIHLEFADTAYEGSFTMINQQFIEHEFADTEFVNREEDMGIEGLHKAKMSYKPVKFSRKFLATVTDE